MTEKPPNRHKSTLKAPCLYTLLIQLNPSEIQPAIWRRLVVDGRISLGKLHHFIQIAFGWTDAHLHEFTINKICYTDPHRDEMVGEIETRDERKGYLNRLLAEGDCFVYLYDFGDSWSHVITVEKVEIIENDPYSDAYVAGGERACPPEDVGGATGYYNFLETVLSKPHSEEGMRLLNWADGEFNPEMFDRLAANAAIQRMLWNRWGGK